KAVIFPAAPNRIGIAQPVRRRVSARGEIHKNIRLQRAPFSHEADRGMEVAIEFASWKNAVHVARAINFELIDSVFADEIQRDAAKMREVSRTRKRESSLIHLKTLPPAIFHALFFGLVISAPGRKPDAG